MDREEKRLKFHRAKDLAYDHHDAREDNQITEEQCPIAAEDGADDGEDECDDAYDGERFIVASLNRDRFFVHRFVCGPRAMTIVVPHNFRRWFHGKSL